MYAQHDSRQVVFLSTSEAMDCGLGLRVYCVALTKFVFQFPLIYALTRLFTGSKLYFLQNLLTEKDVSFSI
jgi:hypothetical protein